MNSIEIITHENGKCVLYIKKEYAQQLYEYCASQHVVSFLKGHFTVINFTGKLLFSYCVGNHYIEISIDSLKVHDLVKAYMHNFEGRT